MLKQIYFARKKIQTITCQHQTHVTHNILAHNIEIKRYCIKKIKRHFLSKSFSCITKSFQTTGINDDLYNFSTLRHLWNIIVQK